MVSDVSEMNGLIRSGVTEPIYLMAEVDRMKQLSKDLRQGIRMIKRVFPGSVVLEEGSLNKKGIE